MDTDDETQKEQIENNIPKIVIRSPIYGPSVNVFDWGLFEKGFKEAQLEKDLDIQSRFSRMEKMYQKEGIRRTVEGLIVVHEHGHPAVLVLTIGGSHSRFPGGKLKDNEDEIEGLKRKLNSKLAPVLSSEKSPEWQIQDLVAIWWRPNFEQLMHPYLPPHVTRPKECKKLFLVTLSRPCKFEAPRNMALSAIPFMEIHESNARGTRKSYGSLISTIPACLSRFDMNFQ